MTRLRPLALLALLAPVPAGARAATIEGTAITCAAPAAHRPAPACALSRALTPHAAPLRHPAFLPPPAARPVAATVIVRPLALAPAPRRLRAAAPGHTTPSGF